MPPLRDRKGCGAATTLPSGVPVRAPSPPASHYRYTLADASDGVTLTLGPGDADLLARTSPRPSRASHT